MRLRSLAAYLLPRLLWTAAQRPPDLIIERADGDHVYLERWHIRRNRFFNLYLHRTINDDDPILHDHPYHSVSLVLTWGLGEVYRTAPPDGTLWERWFRPGDVVFRSRRFAHQLVRHPSHRGEVWTLFLTGPRNAGNVWGFWCPQGRVDWREYLKIEGTTSGVGRGCGEVDKEDLAAWLRAGQMKLEVPRRKRWN